MEENSELETQKDMELDEGIEEQRKSGDRPAAFTLVIQSWATPLIGILMLLIGLLGGYYLRPLISPAATPVAAVEGSSTTDTKTVPIIPTPDAERAVQQQELMTAVVERTRHFLGDPNAPVTIIEFSDFQ